MEFPFQDVSKTYSILFSIFSQIRTDFGPVQGPCTMNVRSEPLDDMACVVKCDPPECRWKLTWEKHIRTAQEWKNRTLVDLERFDV